MSKQWWNFYESELFRRHGGEAWRHEADTTMVQYKGVWMSVSDKRRAEKDFVASLRRPTNSVSYGVSRVFVSPEEFARRRQAAEEVRRRREIADNFAKRRIARKIVANFRKRRADKIARNRAAAFARQAHILSLPRIEQNRLRALRIQAARSSNS